MMSIDEAIARIREVAEKHRNDIVPKEDYHNMSWIDENNEVSMRSAEEHEQLADWLEELKFLKQWKLGIMDSFCKYDASSFEELIANARNKAIDDFVKEICKMIVQSENNDNYRFYAVEIKQAIADIAEQLKAGIDRL